jgi:hypothetical protein
MHWIAEKTGAAVTQVAPNTVVRLKVDGSIAHGEQIKVIEEPEPILRALLRRLGPKTRRPVATLRIDTSAAMKHKGVVSERWHASHLPPPETVTRLVAKVGDDESPPLFVGGPVQVRIRGSRTDDAKLGIPVLEKVITAEIKAGSSRSIEIEGTGYGAIDPDVRIRAITPADELFTRHFQQAIEATTLRYPVGPRRLSRVWDEVVRDLNIEGGGDPISSEVALSLGEGETQEFTLELSDIRPGRFPLALAVFDLEGALISVSDITVVTAFG